jgi:prevent-host-death family protein
MSVWKLEDAKSRFSEVVRRALTRGPQRVTRHGQDAVVVVAAAEYDRLVAPARRMGDFLADSPLAGLDLPARSRDRGRRIEL